MSAKVPFIFTENNFGQYSYMFNENFRNIVIDHPNVGLFDGCEVYNSVNISVPDATPTALTFNSQRENIGVLHTIGDDFITISRDGRWAFGGSVWFAASAVGDRLLWVELNGATTILETGFPAVARAATQTPISISRKKRFVEGDVIRLKAFQDSGGPLNVEVQGEVSPEFWAYWEGP